LILMLRIDLNIGYVDNRVLKDRPTWQKSPRRAGRVYAMRRLEGFAGVVVMGDLVEPSVSYIAVLWNAASPLQVLAEKQVHAAAQVLRMRVLSLGVKNEEEIKNALAVMARERPGALLVLADRLLLHHRALIMDFAIRSRLPGVHAYRELVEAGGLMSFGPSYADMHRRAAYFVDRILKGTKPGDLPAERPRTFDLVVNLKAAKALGLTIPQSVLPRATEIIQ
jgi:ABC-type uncharacterized transport system substrate-binding protein